MQYNLVVLVLGFDLSLRSFDLVVVINGFELK
jgi:hypothetical protein